VILQGVHGEDEVLPIVKKMIRSIRLPIELEEGVEVVVYGSAGISLFPTDADSADLLCRQADIAMYDAKSEHNTYRFFRQMPEPG